MKRIERLKLYPTRQQAARLQLCLDVCRQLYNIALEQRRDAWRSRRHSITYRMQYQQVTELRGSDTRMAAVYRELQDAALHRLDLAFSAFFRRLRAGPRPGFPRYRAAARYNTLEFPHGNRALKLREHQAKIYIPGVGTARIRKGRRVPPFGRAMVVRSARGWFVLFECEREPAPLPQTGRQVGIDLGVLTLYATSNGGFAPHLRLGETKARILARAQRRVARRARGSARRRHAAKMLARAQDALRWARRDWHHKLVYSLMSANDSIVLEKLQVRNMTRSARGTIEKHGRRVRTKAGLNRLILDAGWRQFASMLVAKAEEAGRQVVFVNAAYSSQTCAQCGHVAAENRRTQTLFVCASCGHQDHADVNAARVILRRAELPPAGSSAELSDRGDPRNELSWARNPVTQTCCVRAHPTNGSSYAPYRSQYAVGDRKSSMRGS